MNMYISADAPNMDDAKERAYVTRYKLHQAVSTIHVSPSALPSTIKTLNRHPMLGARVMYHGSRVPVTIKR